MKNLLKMSLLCLVVVVCAVGCGDGKKQSTGIDTLKVDSLKKDTTTVKPDTAITQKDSTKK
ncbi:MAG: hypothetical protein ACXVAY_14965 [Mucilaginibacter sp.]